MKRPRLSRSSIASDTAARHQGLLTRMALLLLVVGLLPLATGRVAAGTDGESRDTAQAGQSSLSPVLSAENAHVRAVLGDGSMRSIPCRVEWDRALACVDSDGIGMVGTVNHSAPIEPLSASGTNGRVTIRVIGSSTQVDDWTTRAVQIQSDGCIRPDAYFYGRHPSQSDYYIVAVIFFSGPCVSVPPIAHSIDWWTFGDVGQNGGYIHGTQLCNAWEPGPPLSGFPCILIKQ